MIADEVIYCSLSQLTQLEYPSKRVKTQLKPRSACQWTGPLKDLDIHLAHNCEFAPVPCPNQGCSITPIRSQLANHLNDCLFRAVPCPQCASLVILGGQSEHLETCGKVSLTCTDCQAPYLREDEPAHDLTRPEKHVECPFECHGCSDAVARKDFDQHQIDSAVSHSELYVVKQRLSNLESIKDRVETIIIEWTINNVSSHLSWDRHTQQGHRSEKPTWYLCAILRL